MSSDMPSFLKLGRLNSNDSYQKGLQTSGDKAQWGNCSPLKCENLSSEPQHLY